MVDRLRTSPWAAVALAALVAAFCGNAIAGSQERRQAAAPFTAKKAKRLFNRLLNRRAAGLTVARAKRADEAGQATAAATAIKANDATTVNGLQVRELFFAGPADASAVELFNGGGLSINATCPSNVATGPELSATATGVQEGALKFVGRGFSPGNQVGVDEFRLNSSDPAIDLDAGEDRGAANLSFIREDGATVNGVISWDDGVRSATDLCGVSGALIVG